jgi:DNA-binding PadR family transcriptional regulator
MDPSREPETLLPLSPVVFAILSALSIGEKHGYAIMKHAALAEGGAVTMGPGTLYGSIDRMIRDALIEETGFTDDARRRYYRITSFGHTVLTAEARRLTAALTPLRSIVKKPAGARS